MQVVYNPMEKTVNTLVVNIVLTRLVIDLMEFVSLVVKVGTMDKNVGKVFIHEYLTESCLLFIYRGYLLPFYIINFIYIKF